MRRESFRLVAVLALALIGFADPVPAQGPGSCGIHLNIHADLTSTHSAIADMPMGVGGLAGPGIPPGPGNPYTAWASPGSLIRIELSVPGGTLPGAGPPFGPGSVVTLFWAIGAPNIPFPVAGIAPAIPDCAGTGFVISSVIPGIGVYMGGAIPLPFADPGYPGKLEVSALVPLGVPVPVMMQALIVTPGGVNAVSNGVSLLTGPNPAEGSLLAPPLGPPIAECAGTTGPLDDGQVGPLPTPAGFTFYGFPAPTCDVSTNGNVDFCPGAATCGGCDFSGASADLGCGGAGATARPRIEADHFDMNFALAVPPPLADLTVEMAPAGPGWPARMIVRWKNVAPFGALAPFPTRGTATCELWGDGRIAVVRNRLVTAPGFIQSSVPHDQVGIGPGLAAAGFGGPPPAAAATCATAAGIDFSTVWGVAGGFPAAPVPGGAIHMDSTAGSLATTNLAIVFTPMLGGPLPVPYIATVF